jgi:hypothetical protein
MRKKKEQHKQDLVGPIDRFLKGRGDGKIIEYLVSNSNLPGPRANLELGRAFAETIENYFNKETEKLWALCFELTNISPEEAPANSPREFLTFCGAYALGAIGSLSPRHFQKTFARLRELAEDKRWRTREAVAMAIQMLIINQAEKTFSELERWISNDDWLAMRGVSAWVSEPALL